MSIPRIVCDRCGAIVPREASYVARIDLIADPSPPVLDTSDLGETTLQEKVESLVEQLRDVPTERIENDVFQRIEMRLCRSCRLAYARDPCAGRS